MSPKTSAARRPALRASAVRIAGRACVLVAALASPGVVAFHAPSGSAPRGAALHSVAPKPSEQDRFAGRYAVGKNMPPIASKQGMVHTTVDGKETRVLGGACSEVLGGANLAAVLEEGFQEESRQMAALRAGEPATCLSVHTSVGVPSSMDRFIDALAPHVGFSKFARSREREDWCVNLQAEGSSAVHAAIDMSLQMLAVRFGVNLEAPDGRTLVACGANSYHGPPSTSPGGKTPLGARAKGLTHPVRYPTPSPFFRLADEDDETFHARLLSEFEAYLDRYAADIGVLLVEPQWGSSVAAMPWPPALLRAYVRAAQKRDIMVISDEIMCGLGRHGQEPGPNGGTGCFLAECWDLKPDVVTFGKSIGGGSGHLLSGAVLLHGAKALELSGRTAYQSHTYAGSSARALSNGAAIFEQLPTWRPSVQKMGETIAPIIEQLNADCGGALIAHGQGCLWGGLFAHGDPSKRSRANLIFKKKCEIKGVLPYYVPVGGFMITPRFDDDVDMIAAAMRDLADCARETCEEMKWKRDSLVPALRGSKYEPAAATGRVKRDLGTLDAAAPSVPRFVTAAGDTDDGLLAPVARANAPLADAAQSLGAVLGAATSLEDTEAAVAILATAYAHRASAMWSSHVDAAREAGLDDEAIAKLAQGDAPAFESGSRAGAVYDIVADLLYTRKVDDSHYAEGVEYLGDQGFAELVSLVGYHSFVALTVTAFEVGDDECDLTTDNCLAPWETDAKLGAADPAPPTAASLSTNWMRDYNA